MKLLLILFLLCGPLKSEHSSEQFLHQHTNNHHQEEIFSTPSQIEMNEKQEATDEQGEENDESEENKEEMIHNSSDQVEISESPEPEEGSDVINNSFEAFE